MRIAEIWHLILEPESNQYILLSGDLLHKGSNIQGRERYAYNDASDLLFHERRAFGKLVATMLNEKYEV